VAASSSVRSGGTRVSASPMTNSVGTAMRARSSSEA
jgi:hypothetical protein